MVQSDRNSFRGDIVLESVNMECLDLLMMILIFHSDVRKLSVKLTNWQIDKPKTDQDTSISVKMQCLVDLVNIIINWRTDKLTKQYTSIFLQMLCLGIIVEAELIKIIIAYYIQYVYNVKIFVKNVPIYPPPFQCNIYCLLARGNGISLN